MMKYSTLFNEVKGKLKRVKFTNEHGEDFYLIDLGFTLAITGHETDWDVMPLFNKEFDMWSPEELSKLADAIKELIA
jgi:hypothetical protein